MMADFDPRAIFDALDRHGVRYVLIGGMAAILHGASHVTTDVDVVPQDARENLERLSAVLKELHARIRVAGERTGDAGEAAGEGSGGGHGPEETRRTLSPGSRAVNGAFAAGLPPANRAPLTFRP